MKITKSYLKQVIEEEIQKISLEETTDPAELQKLEAIQSDIKVAKSKVDFYRTRTEDEVNRDPKFKDYESLLRKIMQVALDIGQNSIARNLENPKYWESVLSSLNALQNLSRFPIHQPGHKFRQV